jgi:hypothetical protein
MSRIKNAIAPLGMNFFSCGVSMFVDFELGDTKVSAR